MLTREGGEGLPLFPISILLGDACCSLGFYEDALQEYYRALKANPAQLYPLKKVLGLVRSERVAVDWGYLSAFASLEAKRSLREQLVGLGEFPLAVIISLLMVVEALEKKECGVLRKVCLEHLELLKGSGGRSASWDYLLIAARELLVSAEVSLRWPLLAPTLGLVSWSGVRELALASLEAAVKALSW